MYILSIVLWYYVLLFIASSSESLGNSTNSDEQRDNSSVRYDLFVNSMKDRDDKMQLTLYNLHENSTKDDDEMQHEIVTKIYRSILQDDFQNDSTLQKFNENLIKTGGENISYEFYQNSNSDDHNNSLATIVSYEACDNKTCIQLCCPFGYHLSRRKCIAGRDNYSFPEVYWNNSKNKKLDELFQLTVRNPCVLEGSAHRILEPDEYSLFANGSLYLDPGEIIPSTSYCLAALDRNIYDVIVCKYKLEFSTYITVLLLVSLPFLLVTFIVYSILPELRNIHGYTLRVYVVSLFNTHVIIYFIQEFPELSEMEYCMPLAYIFNFSIMSGIFWLNAMCFDIWWTFRKLQLDHINVQHRKNKKFVLYSIYAWGITFVLCVTCAIMDHAPGIPKYLIRPEMCRNKFWFGRIDALTVYYYIPMGIAFATNIFFFVTTTITILYHNKHTVHQLRESENRCYNQKKRKFGMYLRLFSVMGVNWVLGTVLWVINASIPVPKIVWNINYTIDVLRGPIVFIIYVCQKKILRLLLKRFGWLGSICNILKSNHFINTFSKNSSSTETVSMQNFNPSNEQINHQVESNK